MTGEQLRLMIQIAKRVQEQFAGFVDRQHQHPTGAIGRAIGERMVRQHAPETDWTIAQLEISPVDRVLELGFGAGRGIALAAEQAYRGRVVGIDLSTTMVQAARRRNKAAIAAGRVTLLMGDVEALFAPRIGRQRVGEAPSQRGVAGHLLQFLVQEHPGILCCELSDRGRIAHRCRHPDRLFKQCPGER